MTWKSLAILVLCAFLYSFSSRLNAQINVDFSVDVNKGCGSVQSVFSDQSTSSNGKIVSWSWNLAGVNSELENPGRIFTTAGTYNICLTVVDEAGEEASRCKEDFITVFENPQADFEVDLTSGCAPLLVKYNDLSQSPNGEITHWIWGLNGTNGIIETTDPSEVISSTYLTFDTYSVSLSVIDENGCTNTVTKEDLIKILPKPELNLSTDSPIGCTFPQTVDFKNNSSALDMEFKWDFGNGETFEGFDPDPVTYENEGDYSIQLIGTNTSTSCTDTLLLENYINTGGTIVFDFYPKRICPKGAVQFEDQSPIEATSWEWDFGDGSTSSERDPSHIYQQPGTYEISLKRKTSECEGIQTSRFKVEVDELPTLDYTIDLENDCKLPAKVNLNENSGDQGRYRWYLGSPGNYLAIPVDPNSSYEFTTFGSYEVRLLKENDIGCRTIKLIDTIDLKPLQVRLTGNPEGCVPFTADLGFTTNSSSPITEVSWKISGDQSLESTADNISVAIDDVSNYLLELSVANELGCVDTLKGNDILKGGLRPSVDFNISDDEVCPMETIEFQNQSTGPQDTWIWTFNDSTFNYEQNPEITFNSPGYFDVQLQVGHNGCYSSMTRDSLILVNFPGVSFKLEYNCEAPKKVKVINSSTEYDSLYLFYSLGSDTTILTYADSIEIDFPTSDPYVVSLEAFNFENGCENIVSDTVSITDLRAGFTIDKEEGCTPLIMQFEDQSEGAISWQYLTEISKFNDDTIPNPTLRINPPGEYTEIGQVVTDIHGCTDTLFADPIRVNRVDAAFQIPDPTCVGDTMHIENTSISFFGEITNVKWVLGDDLQTSFSPDGGFSLKETGKHDIKVVTEDSWGCIDSTTIGLAAFFRAPNFELEADSSSCTTHAVSFKNVLHADNYSYAWSFGDENSSLEFNPAHMYTSEGIYTVSVIVEDSDGCINELNAIHQVDVADPVASFLVDTAFTSCPPLVTNFTNLSSNSNSYSWDFGDESGLSSEVAPAHLYITAGAFDVALISTRTPFCKDTLLIEDLILLNGPRGEFSFDVDSSCVPLKVNFEAVLDENYRLIWDFGDGNLQGIEGETNFSEVEYIYEQPGSFVPKMILEDNENCKITREGEPVLTHALEAKFGAVDSIFCTDVPDQVVLMDSSFSTTTIQSYTWKIGGEILTGNSPSFAIQDTGIFDVELIVDNTFCQDTLIRHNFIRIGMPPVINPIQDTFNCIRTELVLTASSQDPRDRFVWMSEEGLTLSQTKEIVLTDLMDDESFVLQVENEYNCSAKDTVNVQLIDDQTPFAGEERTICLGAETEVSINYGIDIVWEGLEICDTCTTVTLSPDTLTYYPIQVKNEFGCTLFDTLRIDVLTQEDIDAGADQSVCITERPVLLAYATGDISWSPAELFTHPNDQITAVNLQESRLLFLETTKDECTLRDSVYVTLIEKAQIEAIGDTVCFGEFADLKVEGEFDRVRWESMGESILTDPDILNPSVYAEQDQSFMAIANLGGCIPDTAYAHLMVYPEIKGHLPEERQYFKGQDEVEVVVKVSSSGAYSYSWFPSELVDCPHCPTVMVQTADSTLAIEVEIMDIETGCLDTLQVKLRSFANCEQGLSGIAVPNVFSPNEDGINDFLQVEAPDFEIVNSIAIYDRWGEQVFAGKDQDDSWDGNHDGNPVQMGVYTYVIGAICPENGAQVYQAGDVTVIR